MHTKPAASFRGSRMYLRAPSWYLPRPERSPRGQVTTPGLRGRGRPHDKKVA